MVVDAISRPIPTPTFPLVEAPCYQRRTITMKRSGKDGGDRRVRDGRVTHEDPNWEEYGQENQGLGERREKLTLWANVTASPVMPPSICHWHVGENRRSLSLLVKIDEESDGSMMKRRDNRLKQQRSCK